jgi:hypothetical protein
MLLNHRNEIAHGAANRGIVFAKYERLRIVTIKIMDEVKKYVMDALTQQKYLRA